MPNKHAKTVTANLVNLLKDERKAKGLSHQTLADAAGLNRSTISRVESGEHTPTITVCLKIAQALETSLPALLNKASEQSER